MIYDDALNDIIENVSKITKSVSSEEITKMTNMISEVDNVFIMGLGRSGLVAKAFGMRLMHLGLNVYIVGETITPAITDKDCLIAISGSGETSYIVSTTGIAKSIGAKIIAITSYTDSTLAKESDLIVQLQGRTKIDDEPNYIRRQISGQHQTLSPMGTIFEISALIFLDSTIAQMMHNLGQTEEDLKARHTVLE
ncbi:MAG: 6-phospho-3-hexuloisomerase [Methanosphaera sp.]|uniref:6-phospho-3-hexuloisomerase n=1 Tax=Methanosphaera sp. ISO3-F5 TaxID=1452353 RepID=UPI002B25C2B4|nr:6-phospho-3-hexuloisomerase [Methanosphaera sp. ISO3-F5]MBR0471223.1 6-phospho-3-hexuloisomerase [Methanosphaera sp.]WQH65144.1 6-phospho-3-hexuloisomerase [Methanosphaera sp. ISO3-F5]